MTIWSRSMIQDFGENYTNEQHDAEPMPIQCRPYSLLGLGIPLGTLTEPYEKLEYSRFEQHLHQGCVCAIDNVDDTAVIAVKAEEGNAAVSGMLKLFGCLAINEL